MRHAVVMLVLGAGTAIAPLRAQVAVPAAAHRASMSPARSPLPAPSRARAAAPASTWHAVKVGIGIGGVAGLVIGGIIGSHSIECGGDNSGVCPMLGALAGGTIGFVGGMVVGGVAGYAWHRTRPAVR